LHYGIAFKPREAYKEKEVKMKRYLLLGIGYVLMVFLPILARAEGFVCDASQCDWSGSHVSVSSFVRVINPYVESYLSIGLSCLDKPLSMPPKTQKGMAAKTLLQLLQKQHSWIHSQQGLLAFDCAKKTGARAGRLLLLKGGGEPIQKTLSQLSISVDYWPSWPAILLNQGTIAWEKLHLLLRRLDHPLGQIEVDVYVLNLLRNDLLDLGLHVFSSKHKALAQNYHIDLPLAKQGAMSNLWRYFSLGKNPMLDIQLTALEVLDQRSILARSRLVFIDHGQAEIEAGYEIPVKTIDKLKRQHLSYKKAVLHCQLSGRIVDGETLRLQVQVQQQLPYNFSILEYPILQSQSYSSELLVHVGNIYAVGGMLQVSRQDSRNCLPFLSSIPVIGKLFCLHKRQREDRQLWILLKPRIKN
jgi:hypothetical protein